MLLAFVGSPIQLLIVLVIILLLFGSRLPGAMRSLGKSMTEFKKGINDKDPPTVLPAGVAA